MYKAMEQINQEYDGQWVFMINCIKGEYGVLVGGEVVLHSHSKAEVVIAMEEYDYTPGLTSFRYAGKIPEGVTFVL